MFIPPVSPPPRGIKFSDALFTEPESFPSPLAASLSSFIQQEGLYAILTDDPGQRPRPFRLLYIGESENVRGRAAASHECCDSWRQAAGTLGRLYRAFHAMPGSTQRQRQLLESAIMAAYNPPCNQKLSFGLAALLGGVGGLGGR